MLPFISRERRCHPHLMDSRRRRYDHLQMGFICSEVRFSVNNNSYKHTTYAAYLIVILKACLSGEPDYTLKYTALINRN